MTIVSNARWNYMIPSMFDLGEPQPHPGGSWRELLETHGISQAKIARETNTSAKHINQIITGAALPSAYLVIQMARVLASANEADYGDDGRRLARLMWTMQSRHVFDNAMLATLGASGRERAERER